MGIILYGAGKRGKKFENILYTNGVRIKGFCDSYKNGSVECHDGRRYPIYTMNDILRGGEDQVIVTVANYNDYSCLIDNLTQNNIMTCSIEDIIKNSEDIVANNRTYVAEYHVNEMNGYFEEAEKENSLRIFWGADSAFLPMFNQLDVTNIVELACGRGRHVPQYIERAKLVTLVDILDKNIQFCKERFKGNEKINYYVNNGYDLQDLDSQAYTSIFTYDAMVHFEMLDIFNYLKETYRILKNGGRALFHHSNNTENYRITFSTGTLGRNYMSSELFAYLVNRAGLRIIEQRMIDWEGLKNLDCLTLVEK